jgi:hypothetical protein
MRLRCAALALVAGAMIGGTTRASAEQARPAVAVALVHPFTVRGLGFVPSERVTVVASLRGRHVRHVTADRKGTFTARFRHLSARRCDGWFVNAAGDRGSRASLRLMPMCVPGSPLP